MQISQPYLFRPVRIRNHTSKMTNKQNYTQYTKYPSIVPYGGIKTTTNWMIIGDGPLTEFGNKQEHRYV